MGWGTTSRRKTEAHEKSMGSYERHAWSDALAMASYLDEEIGADKARKIYEDVREVDLRKYEEDTGALIQDFIKRSESQRPSVLKKLPDERTRVVFQVLAILGCLRAKEVIDLRDRYRLALAPGAGYRVTTASLYGLSEQMRSIYTYAWPLEVFDALGIDDLGDWDDDEI